MKNLLKKAKEIERAGFYPLLILNNKESKHSPLIQGELFWFEDLNSYYEEEFNRIIAKGIEIWLERGSSILKDTSIEFLKAIDGKTNNIDNNKKRLFLFSPQRIQYSLERLKHYTATQPKDFQKYILLTNYEMHLEVIKEKFKEDKNFRIIESERTCQMRTIHIQSNDSEKENLWFTIVNIWIWPSNAKNITDHLAILRPNLWIMVWHCWWLRNHQSIGEFVLADKFVTDCWILRRIQREKNPIPILPTFNLNILLNNILEKKKALFRMWTVFTTEDRNWELSYQEYKNYFDEDKSIAIDMESAIISAQGFRYKIPNTTLLMISDKPFHWELKKSKESQEFYKNSKKVHLDVLIELLTEVEKNKEKYLEHNSFKALLGAKDDSIFR